MEEAQQPLAPAESDTAVLQLLRRQLQSPEAYKNVQKILCMLEVATAKQHTLKSVGVIAESVLEAGINAFRAECPFPIRPAKLNVPLQREPADATFHSLLTDGAARHGKNQKFKEEGRSDPAKWCLRYVPVHNFATLVVVQAPLF